MTLWNLTANVRHNRISHLPAASLAASAVLGSSIQAHLGQQLRAWYGNPAERKLPANLARLLNRVTQLIRARTEPIDQAFFDGVLLSIPSLRAFAISLTRDADRVEDLVQETVLRAISKQEQFEVGTNLRAWLFTILRNQFCSDRRGSLREVEDVDGSYAEVLISVPDQEDRIMLHDLEIALGKLPQVQREAILLVGAEGLSYEEAAQALGCAVGTVKSPVYRARNGLAELMGHAHEDVIVSAHHGPHVRVPRRRKCWEFQL
jgi:RNA polymerase sigma-70 factor, ECF subfamily